MARQVRAHQPYPPRTAKAKRKKGASLHKQAPKAHKTPAQPHKRPAQADAPPELQHPPCAECGHPSALVGGDVLYPHRPDLARQWFWRCPLCKPAAYVGCHAGGDGKQALGRPAGPHLRRGRQHLKELVNDLWIRAENMPCYFPFEGNAWQVRSSQRTRVYAYIRVHMRLETHEAHVGWMDLAQCRECWRLLRGIKPQQIREWWKNGGQAAFEKLD